MSGNSGVVEPTWNQSSGATTTDNTVTWIECTALLEANTITGLEATGNAYARPGLASGATNFASASGSNPSTTTTNVSIDFPAATPSGWGQVVGYGIFDALTGGNLYLFGYLQTLTVYAGAAPAFLANQLTISVS